MDNEVSCFGNVLKGVRAMYPIQLHAASVVLIANLRERREWTMNEFCSADKKRVRVRFFVSLSVGIAVTLISTVVAWLTSAGATGLNLDQCRTRIKIMELSEAIFWHFFCAGV